MQLISGQPQRSFNHHLSLGGGEPPVCDRGLRAGWFRFDSPAGSLMPTECPGGNYCGTHMPVWMKGEWMYEENMPIMRKVDASQFAGRKNLSHLQLR